MFREIVLVLVNLIWLNECVGFKICMLGNMCFCGLIIINVFLVVKNFFWYSGFIGVKVCLVLKSVLICLLERWICFVEMLIISFGFCRCLFCEVFCGVVVFGRLWVMIWCMMCLIVLCFKSVIGFVFVLFVVVIWLGCLVVWLLSCILFFVG